MNYMPTWVYAREKEAEKLAEVIDNENKRKEQDARK